MNVLLIRKGNTIASNTMLGPKTLLVLGILCFIVLPIATGYGGYYLAKQQQNARNSLWNQQQAQLQIEQLKAELARQKQQISQAEVKANSVVADMNRELAKLQARLIRLDALGQRLVSVGGLDKEEFNFSQNPAQGGPHQPTSPIEVDFFFEQIKQVSEQVRDRENKLNVLENLFIDDNIQGSLYPTGKPIKKGWVSSSFGWRNDPIKGNREFHEGIDYAAKRGTKIYAVAGGVVTFSGTKSGYGYLIEINHGNGYTTRYGHCQKLLKEEGDVVERREIIALVGSTGRSTGPHIHYEVRRNGKVINPLPLINAPEQKLAQND